MNVPALTQVEMSEGDIEFAEQIAAALGYRCLCQAQTEERLTTWTGEFNLTSVRRFAKQAPWPLNPTPCFVLSAKAVG
jgi:hypothetical protein